jgi:hypothetical protein
MTESSKRVNKKDMIGKCKQGFDYNVQNIQKLEKVAKQIFNECGKLQKIKYNNSGNQK